MSKQIPKIGILPEIEEIKKGEIGRLIVQGLAEIVKGTKPSINYKFKYLKEG